MIRRLTAVLLLLACAPALAACGERHEPEPASPPTQPLELVLDYLPNADHAGIYAAQARGDFRKAGLDVHLRTPTDPAVPLQLVAAGRADVAISYEPDLLLARAKGAKVQAVGALVQRPLTSLVSLPGPQAVRSARDLRGKRVGTAGIPYQDAYLRTILHGAGLAPDAAQRIDVGFNLVPTLLSRRVDASLAMFWNVEGIQLRRQGRHPIVLPVDRLGVPTYDELVLVAREDTVRNRGALLRRLLGALARGHEALRRDPAVGIEPLLQAAHGLRRPLAEAQVRATLPAFFPSGNHPFGWMEPGQWELYARWMARNGLIPDPVIAARAFTDEFLPGQGI